MQIHHRWRVLAGIVLVSVCLAPAWAEFTGVALTVDARSATGAHAQFVVTFDQPVASGEYFWSLARPVNLVDPTSHALVGRLDSMRLHYIADPQISLDFSMQAGDAPTDFTVESALLPIDPPMVNPQARASAGINLTDFDGNGAQLNAPTGLGAVIFRYNAPSWVTYAQGIDQILVTEPFGSNGASFDAPPGGGYSVIPDTVTNMGERIHFTVSANDFASGTSQFEIIPEPASLLLVVLGSFVLRRR